MAQLNTDLAAKGRALIALTVELHDKSSTHVLSASVEWFIQQLDTNELTLTMV